MASSETVAEQDYQVQDPTGAMRTIRGPVGASDEDILRQAQILFAPRQTPASDPSFNLGRATSRAATPFVAGTVLGGAAGSVIPGVGTVAGAGMGALAMTLALMGDRMFGWNSADKIMDKLGMPKPQNPEEHMAAAVTESVGNMGGMLGGAANLARTLKGPGREIAEGFAASPASAMTAAVGGGAAQEAVRQEPPGIVPEELGGNQTEQFLANLAGSTAGVAALPIAANVGRVAAKTAGDMKAAVGAAAGHQPSINRLAEDVVQNLTKENAGELRPILQRGTTIVPGATPTVKEVIAEANLKDPTRQVGGALVKLQDELSGAKGMEDVLPSKMRANEAAVAKHVENVDAQTKPLREAALGRVRASHLLGKGVPVAKIEHDILMESLAPGFRSNQVLRVSAQDISRQLKKELTQYGTINPDDLYTIRMNIGNTVRKHFEKSGGRWDAKLAGGFERNIQRTIDDAIEASGGVGWKAYLREYSQGMQKVSAHKERLAEAERISKGLGSQVPEQLVREELPHIPNLLSRPALFANFVLKYIAKDATTPVMREIATRMQDPEQFLQLMARPAAAPAKQAMDDVLMHAAILSNLIQKHQAEQAKQ